MKNLKIHLLLLILTLCSSVLIAAPSRYELMLIDAVKAFDKPEIESLIKRGINPSVRDSHGKTALHYSVVLGNEDIIRILLSSKLAKINVKDINGETMLNYSFKIISPYIANMLITEYNADLNSLTYENETYLHCVSATDFIDIAKLLISKKATELSKLNYINFPTKGGFTALHFAAGNNEIDMVVFLVESGAYINVRALSGEKPSDVAQKAGYLKIAEYLRARENL